MIILVLVATVVLDWVFGVAQAIYNNSFKSSVGRKGLINHTVCILLYVCTYYIFNYMGWGNAVNALIVPAIINQLGSIVENCRKMNIFISKGLADKTKEANKDEEK